MGRHDVPERSTRTWRFVVAYDGTAYQGWQRQEGARTVQDVLENAIAKVAGLDVETVVAKAAGRTDAGVHARGQVVSTTFESRVPLEKMVLALGSQLPDDVSVVRADVIDGFDAKRYSVGKRYVYRVHNAAWRDPFTHRTSWHVRQPLDIPAMQTAARVYIGENDFESFRSAQCDAAHARRYIWKSSVRLDEQSRQIEIEIRGNAFCRHMVRCLAGTLVDVGRGRFDVADVADILEARDRTRAGVTAPALGLTLEEVYYPDRLDHAGIPSDAHFPGFPVAPEDWPPTSAG